MILYMRDDVGCWASSEYGDPHVCSVILDLTGVVVDPFGTDSEDWESALECLQAKTAPGLRWHFDIHGSLTLSVDGEDEQ